MYRFHSRPDRPRNQVLGRADSDTEFKRRCVKECRASIARNEAETRAFIR